MKRPVARRRHQRGVNGNGSGVCRHCRGQLVIGTRKYRDAEQEFYYCPTCASAAAARWQTANPKAPSAVEMVLALSVAKERAMPWEREDYERQIAHWQQQIHLPNTQAVSS